MTGNYYITNWVTFAPRPRLRNRGNLILHVRTMLTVGLLLVFEVSDLIAKPITLDQAFNYAIANNKELKVKRLAVKIAESERLKANLWSPSNPEFELEALSDVLTDNTGEGNIQLGLSQAIELGGQRKHRIEIADTHIEISRLELSATENELKREIETAFCSLLLSQQRFSYARFVDSLALALRDTAAVRVKAGFMQSSELTYLNLDYAGILTNVNDAEATLFKTQSLLLRLIGGSSDSAIEAIGTIDFQPLTISEETAMSLAAMNRPQIRENKLLQAVTHSELNLASSERTPDLKVSAIYERNRTVFSSSDFVGSGANFQGINKTDQLFGIRIGLPLPLIDKRQSEIVRLRSTMDVNATAEQSLDNQIRYEVQSAYRGLKSTEKTVALLRQIQPESDSLLLTLHTTYSQGRVLVSDYLTQKERLLRVRFDLLNAYSVYLMAKSELEKAIGLEWKQLEKGSAK